MFGSHFNVKGSHEFVYVLPSNNSCVSMSPIDYFTSALVHTIYTDMHHSLISMHTAHPCRNEFLYQIIGNVRNNLTPLNQYKILCQCTGRRAAKNIC